MPAYERSIKWLFQMLHCKSSQANMAITGQGVGFLPEAVARANEITDDKSRCMHNCTFHLSSHRSEYHIVYHRRMQYHPDCTFQVPCY
jgi:hypothetical protein